MLILLFHFYAYMSFGQPIDIIQSDKLYEIVDQCKDNTKIKVFNFWATWCAPCIREIPQFESVNERYDNVEVTLISLDDIDWLENKVKPFLIKKAVKSKVVLLNETDFNEIIPKVDQHWSGVIPATLIVNCKSGKKYFYEGEFKEGELTKTIHTISNVR